MLRNSPLRKKQVTEIETVGSKVKVKVSWRGSLLSRHRAIRHRPEQNRLLLRLPSRAWPHLSQFIADLTDYEARASAITFYGCDDLLWTELQGRRDIGDDADDAEHHQGEVALGCIRPACR